MPHPILPFRSFSGRYHAKFNADPVRTATLAYDAVALARHWRERKAGSGSSRC